MTEAHYDWLRYWTPRDTPIALDGGYLVDPQEAYGAAAHPEVRSLEELRESRCLVLLGEPGIGKSTLLELEHARLKEILEDPDDCLDFDLGIAQSDAFLAQELFGHPTFRAWKEGNHKLTVFLDAFDECLLRVTSLAGLLLSKLGEHGTERLSLRLACRSAVWPPSLEAGLGDLWGPDAVQVYSLCPLTERDVRVAADAYGHDGEAFVASVEAHSASPLAARPVTLGMLLRTLDPADPTPVSQVDLYEKGCRELCKEMSPAREAARELGTLDASERLLLSCRVAAILVFGNHNGVWQGVDRGDVPHGNITITDLSSAIKRLKDPSLVATESAIREVLDTALFQDRGQGRLGFSHRTYAEYLAALYVSQHGLDTHQILSLVTAPGDSQSRLVPQLEETAAWIAAMREDVRELLLEEDPTALVKSTALIGNPAAKAQLVEAMLRFFRTGEHFDDWQLRIHFSELCHDGLADQLRPYLTDPSTHPVAQGLAADLVGSCKVSELQGELLAIAVDPSRPHRARKDAIYALREVGDDETRGRLVGLALEPQDDDPDDELKGCALSAVFPGLVSASDVFASLTKPKRPTLIGMYSDFLFHVPEALAQEDLPTALAWVEGIEESKRGLYGERGRLARAILVRSLEHLDDPMIRTPLAKVVLKWFVNHDRLPEPEDGDPIETPWYGILEQRRRLLKATVEAVTDPDAQAVWVVHGQPRLAEPSDVPWILEQLAETDNTTCQRAWALIVDRFLYHLDAEGINSVLEAMVNSSMLCEVLAPRVAPVDLDSDEARAARDSHRELREIEKEIEEGRISAERERAARKPRRELVLPLIEEVERGQTAEYVKVDYVIGLDDDYRARAAFNFDLTVLPGWLEMPTSLQERVVTAAHTFLVAEEPNLEGWPGRYSYTVLAGVRALGTLRKLAPGVYASLESDVWDKWVPAILAFPGPVGSDDDRPGFRKLVADGRAKAPEIFVVTLSDLLDIEVDERQHTQCLEVIEGLWDDEIAGMLIRKVQSEALPVPFFTSIVHGLLDNGFKGASDLARDLAERGQRGERNDQSVSAVALLLNDSPEENWGLLAELFPDHADEARAVIGATLSLPESGGPLLGDLSEQQLGELYVMLVKLYPPHEDREDGGFVGPRETAGFFRDAAIRSLQDRGTAEACTAIEAIGKELDQTDQLKWVLEQARDNARRDSWIPPQPEEIIGLAVNRESRLVNDGDELSNAVVASLGRLEVHLRGETPIAFALWDEQGNDSTWRPKGEETFSDFVKWFLEQDLSRRGIVLNREVVIRRKEGARTGQRTDIHVEAVSGRDGHLIRLIVECKGSWNEEIYTAMESQLVGRYLAENECQHGLYLVGWFDGADPSFLPPQPIDECKSLLHAQAAELSVGGTHVKAVVLDASLTEPSHTGAPD